MAKELLPSWRNTPTRQVILDFINRVTHPDSEEYVSPEARIAVFDTDGTLWCEKPIPIQADFLLRKIGEMARQDTSLRTQQPWKAVFKGDYQWLADVITKHYQGDNSDFEIMAEGLLHAHKGLTTEEYEAEATAFLHNSMHPLLKRPYLECAFQPMVELLNLLRDAGFKNYIVSGGGRDFLRTVIQDIFGISPDCIIGSSVALEYRDTGTVAEIIHKPVTDIFDDGPDKPIRIWSRIGRRPILAVGNSNGDIQMLRYCTHPSQPSMSLLLHHDDEEREFAYRTGAESSLKFASQYQWTIISILNDWNVVFSPKGSVEKAA